MNGYIKYFEKGGKSMSFIIKDDDISDMNDIDISEWHWHFTMTFQTELKRLSASNFIACLFMIKNT